MGALYSKAIKFEMPIRRKRKARRKGRSRETRKPAAVKRTSSAVSVRSSSHPRHTRGFGPPIRHVHEQTHYYNYYNLATNKPQTYIDRTTPSTSSSNSIWKSSKVLVVNPDDENEDGEVNYIRRRIHKSKQIVVLESFRDDFEEIERQLANYPKDDETDRQRAKLRRFVVAWKTSLAFPHTRIIKVSTGIPFEATSHCMRKPKCWKRCRRCFARCSRRRTEEIMEELHKDSIERFMEEVQSFKDLTAEQVIFRNDLTHKKLDEIAHDTKSVDKLASDEIHEEEDDLEIDICVNIPPPVHIEHPPPDQLEIKFSELELRKHRRFNLKDRLKKSLHLDKHYEEEEEHDYEHDYSHKNTENLLQQDHDHHRKSTKKDAGN